MIINRKIQYILVFMLIYSSGATLYHINYNKLLPLFIGIILIMILYKIKKIKLDIRKLILLLFIFSSILSTMSINFDYDISHYIGIILTISLSYFIVILLDYNDLTDIYINIMKFICITSLIFFLLGVLNPQIINGLPTISLPHGQEYKNIYIYNYRYHSLATIQSGYFKNNSFFWEPGAYQAFINMALMLELKKYGFKRSKNILLNIITIMTTMSTTGYISLILILLSNVDLKADIKKNLILSILMAIITIAVISNSEKLFSKFDKSSNNYVSFYTRIEGTKHDYEVWSNNNLLFGNGYNNYILKQTFGSANSITSSLAKYGFIFILSLAFLNYIFLKKVTSNKLQIVIYSVVLIIMYATENFFIAPLFLSLGFTGMNRKI